MSKKNANIEVRMEETKRTVNGTVIPVYQMFIGKKVIAEILEKGAKEFEVEMTDGYKSSGKTIDEATELVIRQWNLHDQ